MKNFILYLLIFGCGFFFLKDIYPQKQKEKAEKNSLKDSIIASLRDSVKAFIQQNQNLRLQLKDCNETQLVAVPGGGLMKINLSVPRQKSVTGHAIEQKKFYGLKSTE